MPEQSIVASDQSSRRSQDEGNDDEEDVTRSGIFTTDGQSTLACPPLHSQRIPQDIHDTTLDYQSLVSGIEDASFLMGDSSLHRGLGAMPPDGEEESLLYNDGAYSIDDSSTDFGNYTPLQGTTMSSSCRRKPNANESTEAVGPTPDRLDDTDADNSVFSGAYNRVVRNFWFPGSAARRKQQDSRSRSQNSTPSASPIKTAKSAGSASSSPGKGGRSTPQTISPKESQETVDNAVANIAGSHVGDEEAGRPQTIVLGKAPTTPEPKPSSSPRRRSQGKPTALTVHTAATVPPSSSSFAKTKVCGLSLRCFIFIVLVIIVAAVGVAVGGSLWSDNDDSSSSPDENETPGFDDIVFPTRAPTASPAAPTGSDGDTSPNSLTPSPSVPNVFSALPTLAPVVPTLVPTRAPIVGTRGPSVSPTSGPTSAPVFSPTAVPTTSVPSSTPTTLCGADDDAATFVLFGVERNCAWFRQSQPNFQNTFCTPDFDPFWACRETCGNCLSSPTGAPSVPPPPSATPSSAPVEVPFSSLEEAILATAPASTATALTQATTAQAQALAWLQADEATVLALPNWRIQQLFAVATFAYAMNLNADGWLGNYDECSFDGVSCAPATGRVVQIDIARGNRNGQLPDEISMLSSLVVFDGRNNNFVGSIPAGFGALPNLITLLLEGNALTGGLPSSLANLSENLRFLVVSQNAMTGPFPNDVLSQMTALELFVSFDNLFTGDIADSVCDLPSLSTLFTDCTNNGCYTQCRES